MERDEPTTSLRDRIYSLQADMCIATPFARVLYILNELLKCLMEYLGVIPQRYSGAEPASKRPQQQACSTRTKWREQKWPAPTRWDTDP